MRKIAINSDKGTIALSKKLFREMAGQVFHIVRGTDEHYYVIPIESDFITSGSFYEVNDKDNTFEMPGLALELDIVFEAEGEPFSVKLAPLAPLSDSVKVRGYKLLNKI